MLLKLLSIWGSPSFLLVTHVICIIYSLLFKSIKMYDSVNLKNILNFSLSSVNCIIPVHISCCLRFGFVQAFNPSCDSSIR